MSESPAADVLTVSRTSEGRLTGDGPASSDALVGGENTMDHDLPNEWVEAATRAMELARAQARFTGDVFTITLHDAIKELRDSDLRDQLTRLPLCSDQLSPWAPRIDIIDPNDGYRPGNIRIIGAAVSLLLGVWGWPALVTLAQAAQEVASLLP